MTTQQTETPEPHPRSAFVWGLWFMSSSLLVNTHCNYCFNQLLMWLSWPRWRFSPFLGPVFSAFPLNLYSAALPLQDSRPVGPPCTIRAAQKLRQMEENRPHSCLVPLLGHNCLEPTCPKSPPETQVPHQPGTPQPSQDLLFCWETPRHHVFFISQILPYAFLKHFV